MKLALSRGDRVLVLGASGWLGQSFLALLPPHIETLTTASRARDRFVQWDWSSIQDFRPTVVVNFAFLTRDRLASLGNERFTAVNSGLINQFLQTLDLPRVRLGLTVSSGAAILYPETAYGELKRAEEELALQRQSSEKAVVVARAYSLSGPYVKKPQLYAFSDLIVQAQQGSVTVTSERPTFRRYVSVADFLGVALSPSLAATGGLVESGGPLVEMRELASEIVRVVNPRAAVRCAEWIDDVPETYASDDTSWCSAWSQAGITPKPLETQIQEVSSWLAGYVG